MEDHTIALLSFDKIREMVAVFTQTTPGRQAALLLAPADTADQARTRLAETAEMARFLELGNGMPPFRRIDNPRDAIQRALKYNRPLAPEELFDIAALLDSAQAIQACFPLGTNGADDEPSQWPALAAMAASVDLPMTLSTFIKETIDARGRIQDGASPKLAGLRQRIDSLRDTIRNRVNALLRKRNITKLLQHDQVSIRNERYVLAVRYEARGQVRGILHGQSQTGSTAYIEPENVVHQGNLLVDALAAARREENRILLALTRKVLDHADAVEAAQSLVAWADVTCAKTALIHRYRFTVPELSEDHALVLHKARHPLLMWFHMGEDPKQPDMERIYREVVPFDLEMGEDFRLLIITGPNTGGKTVVLKTVGLLSLMAATGLPVPSFPPVTIPFYRRIFIDAGDEQSLQQNLSTFSAHLKHIVDVLENAGDRDLVLLDELGAGTDPLEGAALSVSVLDHLRAAGAHTLVSTHLGSLKQYAYTHKEAENGAMEFDPATLRPTFRLLLGIPGRSCALMVAKRLGFPPGLLGQAEQRIQRPAAETEVIRRMEAARRSVEKEKERSRRTSRRIDKMQKKLAKKLGEADDAKKLAGREAEEEIDAKVKNVREKLLGTLSQLKNVPGQFKPHVDALSELAETMLVMTPLGERREAFALSLKRNSEVYVPMLGDVCRVVRINKKKRRITVMAGNMEAEIGFHDVSWIMPEAE